MKAIHVLLPPLAMLAIATAHATDPAPVNADAPAPNGPPPPHRHSDMKWPPPFDPAPCQGKAPGTTVTVRTPDGRPMRGSCQVIFVPEMPAQPPRASPPAGAAGTRP